MTKKKKKSKRITFLIKETLELIGMYSMFKMSTFIDISKKQIKKYLKIFKLTNKHFTF